MENAAICCVWTPARRDGAIISRWRGPAPAFLVKRLAIDETAARGRQNYITPCVAINPLRLLFATKKIDADAG